MVDNKITPDKLCEVKAYLHTIIESNNDTGDGYRYRVDIDYSARRALKVLEDQ